MAPTNKQKGRKSTTKKTSAKNTRSKKTSTKIRGPKKTSTRIRGPRKTSTRIRGSTTENKLSPISEGNALITQAFRRSQLEPKTYKRILKQLGEPVRQKNLKLAAENAVKRSFNNIAKGIRGGNKIYLTRLVLATLLVILIVPVTFGILLRLRVIGLSPALIKKITTAVPITNTFLPPPTKLQRSLKELRKLILVVTAVNVFTRILRLIYTLIFGNLVLKNNFTGAEHTLGLGLGLPTNIHPPA